MSVFSSARQESFPFATPSARAESPDSPRTDRSRDHHSKDEQVFREYSAAQTIAGEVIQMGGIAPDGYIVTRIQQILGQDTDHPTIRELIHLILILVEDSKK